MYQSRKTRRTIYTEAVVDHLRQNLERYDWAKEQEMAVLTLADKYLAMGVETLLRLLPPQSLARSFDVNQEHGCPHCGMEMMRYGQYGWRLDTKNHPWKVQCPNCGRLYPSNDFGAYYESGLDDHGVFSHARADKQYLINELYPEEGPDFAVDDGLGWLRDPSDPQTQRFTFIPYYIHHAIWAHHGQQHAVVSFYGDDTSCGLGFDAMDTLSHAYLLTGDKKYGYAAAAMYYRFALLYPTLDARDYPWKNGYKFVHGHTGLGRMIGTIGDTEYLVHIVGWYDMLWDCIDDAFAAYLREDPARYIGEVPQSGEAVRNAIEEKLLRQVFPDYKTYILNCNPGPPQALLLKTARVLGDEALFDECAEYLFTFIDHVRENQHRLDMESMLLSDVSRDGFGGEISSGYNAMWLSGFIPAAELLRGHKYDLYAHPKFRKMAHMMAAYITADRYTLPLADSGKTGDPGIMLWRRQEQVKFVLAYGAPRDAALLVAALGDKPIVTDWYMDCEAAERTIRDMAASYGPFRSESRCFPDFGLAMTESHPDGKDPESSGIYFGSNKSHGHRDTLNLYLHGFGIDLMPDFGNPSFKDQNPERYRFTSNMASHNTVTVRKPTGDDGALSYTFRHIPGGRLRHWYDDGKVSVISAEAPTLYDTDFTRTVVTVDTDGKSRYLVDFFTAGGEEQHISFHAAGTKTVTDGAVFTKKPGTYAGETVPYADRGYSDRCFDGFNYLTDVRSAKTDGVVTVDWQCEDNWHVWESKRDVHVKLHLLSGVQEVSLCTGMPPMAHRGNPRELTFCMGKHSGGTARFVSVLEPYENAPFIDSCVYTKDGGIETVTVTHSSGRVDVIRLASDGSTPVVTVETTDGLRVVYGRDIYKGRVMDFTKSLTDDNYILVRFDDEIDGSSLVGRYLDIDPAGEKTAGFFITSAQQSQDVWKLGVGDSSPIGGYVDRDHKELGYRYLFTVGASCSVTL